MSVDARRVHSRENVQAVDAVDAVDVVAAEQIRALLGTRPSDAPVPTGVFDAGYDPAHLARELGDLPVAVLVRRRRDRCF
jgi:hypothetical protein